MMWFGERQKYEFLSYPLPQICHVPETVLQIKHWTTEVVLSCTPFFSKSNTPLSFVWESGFGGEGRGRGGLWRDKSLFGSLKRNKERF